MAIAALADGAGSRARSELGAEAVVRASLRLLMREFDALFENAVKDPSKARQAIYQRLLQELKSTAKKHNCDVPDLASTLLFVAHKGKRFIAGHVGDGVIAQVSASGQVTVLSSPENGEFANTTVFVTDRGACDKIRIYCGEGHDLPLGFALMSDGTADSLYEKNTGIPASGIANLLEWNATLSRVKMFGVLDANMKQSFSRKTTDDCALALLSISGG